MQVQADSPCKNSPTCRPTRDGGVSRRRVAVNRSVAHVALLLALLVSLSSCADHQTPSQAAAHRTLAQLAARLHSLAGKSSRERALTVLSMTRPQVSATLRSTEVTDLAPPRRGRLTARGSWQITTGGASKDGRSAYEYVTSDGGQTVFARRPGGLWSRLGGPYAKGTFASLQDALLQDTTAPDARLAGHGHLNGVACVLIDEPRSADQNADLLNDFPGDWAPPKGAIDAAHGTTTLWIDARTSMVLREIDTVDVSKPGVGQWHVHVVDDFSRWGEPVVPPIVYPKGA